jgi:hypothetical protein
MPQKPNPAPLNPPCGRKGPRRGLQGRCTAPLLHGKCYLVSLTLLGPLALALALVTAQLPNWPEKIQQAQPNAQNVCITNFANPVRNLFPRTTRGTTVPAAGTWAALCLPRNLEHANPQVEHVDIFIDMCLAAAAAGPVPAGEGLCGRSVRPVKIQPATQAVPDTPQGKTELSGENRIVMPAQHTALRTTQCLHTPSLIVEAVSAAIRSVHGTRACSKQPCVFA